MNNTIENLNGQELNDLIESEIFDALPLTDDEWSMCKLAWQLISPQQVSQIIRPLKIKLTEPDFETKSLYRLNWSRDYTRAVSDWGGAYQVLIEHMRRNGWLFDLCDYETSDDRRIVTAGFVKWTIRGEAVGDTDAIAIARAALIAVREMKAFEAKAPAGKQPDNKV